LESDLKLLKIKPPIEQSSDAILEDVRGGLRLVLMLETTDKRQECFTEIVRVMGESSLSDWFSLYLRFIFEQIHQPQFEERDYFLDAVGNAHLIKLHHEQMIQYDNMNGKLGHSERQCDAMFFKSSINLSTIDVDFDGLYCKNKQLKTQKNLLDKKTLARFLLIEKILSSLEALNVISPNIIFSIKNEMIHRHAAFIGSLAAIINELYGIDSGRFSSNKVLLKINIAIKSTLKLLGIDGDDHALISLVRDDLFDKKHLFFIDYSQEVTHQSVCKQANDGAESFNLEKAVEAYSKGLSH
jgi:hypothetical protein